MTQIQNKSTRKGNFLVAHKYVSYNSLSDKMTDMIRVRAEEVKG